MARWFPTGRGDTFRLILEYGAPSSPTHHTGAAVRLPKALATLQFDWSSGELESAVLQRFVQRQSSLVLENGREQVQVQLTIVPGVDDHVRVNLSLVMCYPVLRCVQVARVGSSGTASDSLLRALLQHCQQDTVWKLKGAEGFGNFWATALDAPQLSSLRNLNMSYCGLTNLPANIGQLTSLRILRLSHNKLTTLPAELGNLAQLEVLAVDNNQLTSVPVDVRRCGCLKEFNLESNRITTMVLDLRAMHATLQSLQLYGNPLEYLPELSTCSQLHSLSLANVRIMADATYTRWEVEVDPLPYMARGHKLTPLFKLTFRRASLQHPLLAGALSRIAEDRASCELIAKEEVAMQQLVLMALSDNPVVVRTACKTLGHLAECGTAVVRRLVVHDVLKAMQQLVKSENQESQLWGLHLLSVLACAADDISADVLTDSLLQRLHTFIRTGDPTVRQAALLCLSSLSFCYANRRAIRAAPGLLSCIAELAQLSDPRQGSAASIGPANNTTEEPGHLRLPSGTECASPHTPFSAMGGAGGDGTPTVIPDDPTSPVALSRRNTTTSLGGFSDMVGTPKAGGSVPSSPMHHHAQHAHKRQRVTDPVLFTGGSGKTQADNQTDSRRSSSPLRLSSSSPRAVSTPSHHPHLPMGYASETTRLSALRVLAVLGENEAVRVSLRQPAIVGRGLRILALDGGGIKGVVLVQLLRALQERLPLPLHNYWDLVVGTSTGAIVAVSMGMLRMDLDGVEEIYTELGQKVFNAARVSGPGDEAGVGWKDSLYRMYKNSSQTMRVAVYGSKHDPSAFEGLLKQSTDMSKHGCLTHQMIDAVALAGTPKVALVSTVTSVTPCEPYLFRNYELPPGSEAMAAQMAACRGTSRIEVWQAVRASASAPYYLDDFPLGDDRFQDGATTANNPALIALQQARLLWPHLHVDCMVSLGCGVPPSGRRERSMSAYLEMGSVLIESACSTDRVHEALATTLPLLPNTQYFRFQPIDDRCGVELDDVSPASILKLQAAAQDYATAHSARFDALAALLTAESQQGDEGKHEPTMTRPERGGSVMEDQQAMMVDAAEDALSQQDLGPLRLKHKRGLLIVISPRKLQLPPHVCPPCTHISTAHALASLPNVLRYTNLMEACLPAHLGSGGPSLAMMAAMGPAPRRLHSLDRGMPQGAHAGAASPFAGQTTWPGSAAGLGPQPLPPVGTAGLEASVSVIGGTVPSISGHSQGAPPHMGATVAAPAPREGANFSFGSGAELHGLMVSHACATSQHSRRHQFHHNHGRHHRRPSLSQQLQASQQQQPPLPPQLHGQVQDGPHYHQPAGRERTLAAAGKLPSLKSLVIADPASKHADDVALLGLHQQPVSHMPAPSQPTEPTTATSTSTLASPQSQSVSSSFLNYFLPRWGVSTSDAPAAAQQPEQQAGTAPDVGASPLSPSMAAAGTAMEVDAIAAPYPQAFDHHGSATTPPAVQVVQHAAGEGHPVSPVSTDMHRTSPKAIEAGTRQQAQPIITSSSTFSAFMRFPWSTSAGPSSPIVSPPDKPPSPLSSTGLQHPMLNAPPPAPTQPGFSPLQSQHKSSPPIPSSSVQAAMSASQSPRTSPAVQHTSLGASSLSTLPASRPIGARSAQPSPVLIPSCSPALSPVSASQPPARQHASSASGDPLRDPTHQLHLRMSWPSGHMTADQTQRDSNSSLGRALGQSSVQNGHTLAGGPMAEQSCNLVYASEHTTSGTPSTSSTTPNNSQGGASGSAAGVPTQGPASPSPTRERAEGRARMQTDIPDQDDAVALGMSGPSSLAVLQAMLQDLAQAGLGAALLALELDEERHALVTQWTTELVAVVEPSPQASEMVRLLGGDPVAGHKLQDVTRGAVLSRVGMATYTRLMSQEAMAPDASQVCSMLFSVSRPCQWLTAEAIMQAAVDWSDLMVVVTSPVPDTMLEAFLRSGVLCVVCLSNHPTPAHAAALPGMLRTLWQHMLDGIAMPEAVAAAEATQHGLCDGLLVCHHAHHPAAA